jgi:hypothetical protein
MAVQIATGQLCTEMASLIYEQQLISIDSRNAGDSIRRPAFCPLLEPVTPAKFIHF